MLEPFYRKYPDHPGIVHYLIHGYDYPPVAEKGLPAARQYAARHHPDATSFEDLHALDDLVYGYLQTARDGRAKEVVDKTRAVRKGIVTWPGAAARPAARIAVR